VRPMLPVLVPEHVGVDAGEEEGRGDAAVWRALARVVLSCGVCPLLVPPVSVLLMVSPSSLGPPLLVYSGMGWPSVRCLEG
jgi:hypothetical protein